MGSLFCPVETVSISQSRPMCWAAPFPSTAQVTFQLGDFSETVLTEPGRQQISFRKSEGSLWNLGDMVKTWGFTPHIEWSLKTNKPLKTCSFVHRRKRLIRIACVFFQHLQLGLWECTIWTSPSLLWPPCGEHRKLLLNAWSMAGVTKKLDFLF